VAGERNEGAFQEASRIIEQSRVFEAAEAICCVAATSFGESRAVREVRTLAADFGRLSHAEQTRYALLTIGIAAVSYALMFLSLPRGVRPNLPLAVGVLILVVCGGVATRRGSRSEKATKHENTKPINSQ
jgi:hypothetical protein